MALAVARVLQDDAHFPSATNCYFQGAAPCCLVEDRYRFLRWEGRKAVITDPDLDQSHTRIFNSTDQGATWSLLTEFDVPLITQWITMFSPGGNRLLAGITDKPQSGPYDSQYSFLPRSEDGGLTWASSVSEAFYDAFTGSSRTMGFVKLPGTTTVLAFGTYDQSAGGGIGTPGFFNFLRSTDNGVTWATFSTADEQLIFDCVAISATALVASGTAAGYYSTDGGATWNPASGEQVLGAPVSLGSGVLIANGRFSSLSVAWKSVDNGQTWTNHAALSGGSGNRSKTIRALTPEVVIAGTNTTPGDLPRWWLSEDGGDTWSIATILHSQVAASDGYAMTITSQGFMLAGITYGHDGGSLSKGECWRGTVDGFVSTGIGTCEVEGVEPPEPPVVGVGILGVHLLCVPILSPAPCPPVCPADPISVGAQLIESAPLFGVGGGWRSALPILGLASGSLPVGTPAILTPPTACGATFANNYCAVAGA